MIHVIAILTTKPGRRAEVLALFNAVLPLVRAEAGCIEYGPAIDTDHEIVNAAMGEDSFVVIEKWESKPALSAHAKSPHMADYGRKTRDMFAERKLYVLEAG